MPIHETPWGPRLYTETDEAVTRVVLDMHADEDEKMADIGYFCGALIKKHEGNSATTLDVVEWFLSEDDKTYKQMVRFVKGVIKAQKQQLREYNELRVQIENECRTLRGKTKTEKREAAEFLVALRVTPHIEEIQSHIKKNEQILMLATKTPEGEQANTGLNFERAKLVPIDSFIEFKRGFAPCIWHDEVTPSMKYYKKNNRVHCFGCDKGGDVIDVIQQIKECDIKEAVRFLTE